MQGEWCAPGTWMYMGKKMMMSCNEFDGTVVGMATVESWNFFLSQKGFVVVHQSHFMHEKLLESKN